jgi:hypothetical protein
MATNLYDQSSRYLVDFDPAGFFSWLLGLKKSDFAFRKWLNTRAITFPGRAERTSDLVAHLADLLENGIPWALLLEFQIVPDPEMFGRILSYLAAIWNDSRPDIARGSRFWLGAAVVNLTGRGACSQRMNWVAAGLTTERGIRERNLEFERAEDVLGGVESGVWPRSLLPFIPLMSGGDEVDKIERWIRIVQTEPNVNRQADYITIALIFAERVGRKAVWFEKLKGTNMTESAFLNEYISKAHAEGEALGEARGHFQEGHAVILRLGAKRFGLASLEIQATVRGITDRERLERIIDRILDASDWNDLLSTH